ncbi:DUF4236 domain-containing protein [Streptomyces sp. NPDC051105]|uniref:DUF4236 domain-containing protein n=1 Tax=Streptomyces sp. NPDC051105 TaxID=3154843 RepID=UPI00341E3DF0
MGVRINKSFKIAPGVRVRLGNKSSSLSIGGKAGRVTMNTRGRRTTTVRLAPGVSYSTSSSSHTTPKSCSAAMRNASTGARRSPTGRLKIS